MIFPSLNIIFSSTAWRQYTEWQVQDKRLVRRINELIKDIEILKSKYNYLDQEQDEKLYKTHISFYDLKELSKQKIKK